MAANSIKRQYIMLKPMATGANGFARLEAQSGYLRLQLTCKDLRFLAEGLRVFLYAGEGIARELGQSAVNAQGQATLTTEIDWREMSLSPSRLEALLILSDDPLPKPLLIGLCAQQSAGSLMDAKNAMLALCKKLSGKPQSSQEQGTEPSQAKRPRVSAEALPTSPAKFEKPLERPTRELSRKPSQETQRNSASLPAPTPSKALAATLQTIPKDTTPQEVFLSAIDPREHLAKTEGKGLFPPPAPLQPFPVHSEESESAPPLLFPRANGARPVERLRPLIWPARLRELPTYFDRYPPITIFNLPGWRFIRVPMSRGGFFAIGYWAQNGRVARIAYAVPGVANQPPPRQLARYRFHYGLDGQGYWTLGQEIR